MLMLSFISLIIPYMKFYLFIFYKLYCFCLSRLLLSSCEYSYLSRFQSKLAQKETVNFIKWQALTFEDQFA